MRFFFKGEPTFDPTPLYDEAILQAYIDPASRLHGREVTSVPHARVRGSREELTALYRKLDDSRRLALVPLDEADLSKLSGLFGVAKDADRDRLVVDARLPDAYEDSLAYWTYTMASAASLCDIEIGQSEVASIWSDDLTDCYYEFIVSPARERRNVFRGVWPSETFAGFHAAKSLPSGTVGRSSAWPLSLRWPWVMLTLLSSASVHISPWLSALERSSRAGSSS